MAWAPEKHWTDNMQKAVDAIRTVQDQEREQMAENALLHETVAHGPNVGTPLSSVFRQLSTCRQESLLIPKYIPRSAMSACQAGEVKHPDKTIDAYKLRTAIFFLIPTSLSHFAIS